MVSVFSYIDILFVLLYLIVVLSMGFYYSRRSSDAYQNYFLAGKNVGWIAIGISIFAINISSEHFIGLAGAGSVRGLVVGQFELIAIFTLIFLGWFLAPVFIKAQVATVPEFLELNFDRRIRKFFAGFSIINYILSKILVSLFAASLLFYNIFGLNIYASSILIVLITGLYSVIGGATAIVRTQTLQGIILILGALVISVFGYIAVGGFEGIYQKLPSDYLSMFKPASDPEYPWTGIVFGAPIIAFWYWCTDQYIVQRILSASSIEEARKGSLLTASLKILPIFILVLPGLFAAVLYPESKGDSAYAALITGDILPVGLKGFVLAGLLAAIMSSLASSFNSIAILFTNDFYKVKYPESTERKLVLVGRLATTMAVVGAILIVPLVKIISSQVYLFIQSMQSFVSPPITAVFIFGLFSRRMSAKTAIITLIVGESLGIFRMLLELLQQAGVALLPLFEWLLSINFLHYSLFLFTLSVGMILLLNLQNGKNSNPYGMVIRASFRESYQEIIMNLKAVGNSGRFTQSFVFSACILLIIIGVWSVWN